MSDTLINRIVAVTIEQGGPLPDEAAHRRYLAGLPTPALHARLATLTGQEKIAPVEFWGPRQTARPLESFA